MEKTGSSYGPVVDALARAVITAQMIATIAADGCRTKVRPTAVSSAASATVSVSIPPGSLSPGGCLRTSVGASRTEHSTKMRDHLVRVVGWIVRVGLRWATGHALRAASAADPVVACNSLLTGDQARLVERLPRATYCEPIKDHIVDPAVGIAGVLGPVTYPASGAALAEPPPTTTHRLQRWTT